MSSRGFKSSCDSQLEDENDVGSVFKHVVQGHDVGVLDLLQDVHLPLDLLSFHAASAGPALPLLDELGGVFDAHRLVLAAFDDGKLAAVEETRVQVSYGRGARSLRDMNQIRQTVTGGIFHHLKCHFLRRRVIPNYYKQDGAKTRIVGGNPLSKAVEILRRSSPFPISQPEHDPIGRE